MPDTINGEAGLRDTRVALIANLIANPSAASASGSRGSQLPGALELMDLWLGIDAAQRERLLEFARKLRQQA